MSDPSSLAATLTTVGWQLTGLKYASMAGLTTLFYDIFLTFSDEVNYIWSGKFNIVKLNFLINRYVAFGVLSFVLLSSISPSYDQSTCNRYILLAPLLGGIILTFSINIVIYLRIYALYGRNKKIAFALMIYLLAELGVGLWSFLFPRVHPYILPGPSTLSQIPVLHACVWEHSIHLSNLQSAAYQFMQTGYDSLAFVLIISKAIMDSNGRHGLIYKMAKDGFLYFLVVLSLNLTWAFMIIFAPPLLRYAAAQPAIQLQCVCMNRMTLSLKSFRLSADSDVEKLNGGPGGSLPVLVLDKSMRQKKRESWVGISTFETTDADSDSSLASLPGLQVDFPSKSECGNY